MSEEPATCGGHYYRVGYKFDFAGIVEIVGCLPFRKNADPHYLISMLDGGRRVVDEKWLDGGIVHFALAENAGNVYIPADSRPCADCGAGEVINAINSCTPPGPPERVKVGDRVEIIDPDNSGPSNLGGEGIIVECFDKERYRVQFSDGQRGVYYAKYFRKLPTISFENPMNKQVDEDHYQMPIQPVEFIERNGLGFCVGNCIKYLCRYKKKNGREDLEKAKHYIDLLIELEYPDNEKN